MVNARGCNRSVLIFKYLFHPSSSVVIELGRQQKTRAEKREGVENEMTFKLD